jgi:drug/metabolite transporter (DMT)-like permease
MMEKSIIPYLALLLVQLLFGLNFPASKIILEQVPPVLWSAVRMAIAAALMFITAFIIVPKADRKIDIRFLQKTFIYGFFGIVLCQTFFMVGLKNTTSTNGAVLNTLIPIFTLMFAIITKKEKFTLNRAFGFLIAVLGVLVLRKIEDFSASMETFKGDMFMILNCMSLAVFFNISRDFLRANSAFWVTAWMFFFGSIVIGLFCINDLHLLMSMNVDARLGWAMGYNVIGATMLTYFLNSWTLKRVSASSVAVFIYMQPVIAVLYAWIIQNEPPSIRTIVAVLCIFTGVMVGVVQRPGKKIKTETTSV